MNGEEGNIRDELLKYHPTQNLTGRIERHGKSQKRGFWVSCALPYN
jgi:hypothetical protein